VCETVRFGNPVEQLRIPLSTYGKSGDQAGAVTGDAVKTLMDFACDKGKPIAVEPLNFDKKKVALKKEDKRYCRMLSSLSYNKILSTIKARSYDNGIKQLPVNPAFTSFIGKAKFARRYGLSTHQATAYAIARRSLKKSEKPNPRDQLASFLPVRNRNEPFWSY
jgi:IS605 OrfB family transposase